MKPIRPGDREDPPRTVAHPAAADAAPRVSAAAAGRASRLGRAAAGPDAPGRTPPLPDVSQPPTKRGTWNEAALVNVNVTEAIKAQLRVQTPPWKK